jgi:hypothetical protein
MNIKTSKMPTVLRSRSEDTSSVRSVTQNPVFINFIESVHVIQLGMADVCYYPVFISATTVKKLGYV